MIRLAVPTIEEDDLQAVRETLATGFLVQGAKVAEFERVCAETIGSKHVVAVTNCTAALQMALLALDVRPGDMVLVTAYSWISTANVIELCGAMPVFVDIRLDTYNICPDSLQAALARLMSQKETAARVKAIMPVHTFGQVADMNRILEIAGKYSLPVIEDAACALGATDHGRQAGSIGTMGCFSFHPRKAVTTGEGGLITTDNDEIAWKLRAMRNHGQDPTAGFPDFVMPGFNNRMTEFQAALGVTQMRKLDRIVNARIAGAKHYDALLEGGPIQAPFVPAQNRPVYQSYIALLPAAAAAKRPALLKLLRERGVECNIGTWHMPLTTYFKTKYGYQIGDFPNADDVFARSLALPLYEALTPADRCTVVETVLSALNDLA